MSTRDKSYHHGDLQDALLAAGDAVLAERGFKGFTLRECARRAGVSHAAPRHHFGDTAGFLTRIAAIGFDRLTTGLRDEISTATNLDEEYVATTRAYIAFAEQYPEHFRIMFRCDLLDENDPGLRTAASRTFTELTNVILRQRGEAEIELGSMGEWKRPRELIEEIRIGWGHIHGLAHLKLERQLSLIPESEDTDALIATATARLAAAMRASRDGG